MGLDPTVKAVAASIMDIMFSCTIMYGAQSTYYDIDSIDNM